MAFNPVSLGAATAADATFSALGTTVWTAGVTNILPGNAGRFLREGAGPVVGDDAGATFTGTGASFVATLNGLTVTAAPTFSALTATRVPFAGVAGLLGDSALFTYVEASAAAARLTIFNSTAGLGAISLGGNTAPAAYNMALYNQSEQLYVRNQYGSMQIVVGGAGNTSLVSANSISLARNTVDVLFFSSTAGSGGLITAGTATTDVQALSATQTWSNAAVAFTGNLTTITNIASATGSLIEAWKVGSTVQLGITPLGALSMLSTGAAPTVGELTLVGGTKTVNTTAATATAKIFAQRKTAGGTIGFASTYTINAGVSFTLNSDNALDTSTYEWWIVEAR